MTTCVLDFETRSAIKLGRGGTNAFEYAKHPSTSVWVAKYAFTDDPDDIHTWSFGQDMPIDLRKHVETGGLVSAHNASFEYAIWNLLLAARCGWSLLPLSQMTDTAARAARHGLPRALEKAAKGIRSIEQKDMKGSAAMKRMAKPRKTYIVEDVTDYRKDPLMYTVIGKEVFEWWATEDRISGLHKYCGQDVITQMELETQLPELPPMERQIWRATMEANIRGCLLDVDFIDKSIQVIKSSLSIYANELQRISKSQVSSHTDLNGMKRFIKSKGIPVEGLDKNVVASLLADENLPDDVRRIVEIRGEAGKSSVAKFPSMKLHASLEGVAHDQLVYYGAQSTGRWSALGFQLHNLPSRGAVKYDEAEWCIRQIKEAEHPEETIPAIQTITGMSIIEVLSMCLRGAIRARLGSEIVCADYSNIEGRIGAWLGDELWKLEAFRAYDEGDGPDLYKVTAGQILGIDPDQVSSTERNVLGKVSELALGFQGGVGAYASMGTNYGIDMEEYAGTIRGALPDAWQDAVANYETMGSRSDLSKNAWVASETVKLAWRGRHPGIKQSWYDAESAAISAISTIGSRHSFCGGRITMTALRKWGQVFLLMRLPSGRCIYYANVKLRDQKTPWGSLKSQITFDKVEQGRVVRNATYGGDLFQSAVQGTARDIMAHGWLNTRARGYDVLFSVHDELASEAPLGKGDLAGYIDLLCDTPTWAKGCPITASGYVSDRFRKD